MRLLTIDGTYRNPSCRRDTSWCNTSRSKPPSCCPLDSQWDTVERISVIIIVIADITVRLLPERTLLNVLLILLLLLLLLLVCLLRKHG